MDETSEFLPDRVVAFIDILGFGDIVRRMVGGDEKLFMAVKSALEQPLSPRIGYDDHDMKPRSRCDEMTAFSDCIVLSNACGSDVARDPGSPSAATSAAWGVIETSAALAASLLIEGMPCRGGVALGKTYHKGAVAFGQGLIDAYELERRLAHQPRLLVADPVVALLRTWDKQRLRSDGPLVPISRDDPMPGVKRDHDGCWFIDLFHHLSFYWTPDRTSQMGRIRDFIVKALKSTQREQHLAVKYRWLAIQFNESVAEWLNWRGIEPIPISW